jgi:hypothetical protein
VLSTSQTGPLVLLLYLHATTDTANACSNWNETRLGGEPLWDLEHFSGTDGRKGSSEITALRQTVEKLLG